MALAEVVHEQVEGRLSELMEVLNATTAELAAVIGDAIEHETWAVAGVHSVEHWVTWQRGVSPRRARDLVKMARRRVELPATTALFDAGLLTEDAVAAIARRAPADRDAEVAELAPTMLYSQLRRALSALPRVDEPVEPEVEAERRVVSFGAIDDRWRMHADLPLDEGLVVERALAAGRSQVFHERHPGEVQELAWRSSVSWADGLVRMAGLALQAADSGVASNRRPADRYQVLVHLDVSDDTVRWHMGDGLADSVRRYLTCDADVRVMFENDGVLAAMSSRLRTVDDRVRAFIEHRDGGCVVPGCDQRRWLHIHHIRHWENGGPTESPNLCALCPMHHRLLHAGLLTIDGDPSVPFGLVVRDQFGRELRPPPPTPPDHPPDHPPRPFQHPIGERVDWRYFDWSNEAAIDPRYRRNDRN